MENCQKMECSSQEQNMSGEKHEVGSGKLVSEPVETRNCESISSSVLEQNTANEKQEAGSNHVPSQSMDAKIVGYDKEMGCSLVGNSFSKESSQSTLEEKHELNSKPVLAEPIETSVTGSKIQNCKTTDSCLNELHAEHVQQTDTKLVGSGAEMECPIAGNSVSKESTLGEKDELESEPVLAEPVEVSVARSNEQNCQTKDLCHIELRSVQGEPMDTKMVGFDAEMAYPIAGNSVLRETTLGEKDELDSEHVQAEPVEATDAGSNEHNCETTEPCHTELLSEHLHSEPTENMIVGSESVDVGVAGSPPFHTRENSNMQSRSRKRKSVLRSSPGSARVLRPRENGLCKAPDPTDISANVSVERNKKRKMRKRTNKAVDDEFSRTRKRLRYLLYRMGFEHNYIDAYSGEGWKGQSAEKIKPEKELKRASSEILRIKRRIRELFEHLDSLCAEGRFEESLFDSEGLISSEDRTLYASSVLFVLVPPGDEGWLCPGCDCKVDCIDLLNDSQGTNLSLGDEWEKVFPEAASMTAGDMTDEILGLPSDDSEDNEYNPDASDVEEDVCTEGSSSDESDDSDFTSASDDMGVSPIGDQYMGMILGLPSDDSEDDEYDPNALEVEKIKDESSSSDFTSDSEYFSASSDANGSSGLDADLAPSSVHDSRPPGSSNRRSKFTRFKKQSVKSELLSILEPDGQENPSPLLGKRQREQLDYKKLHDETYGNVPSDSSDNEEWAEADGPKIKKDDGGPVSAKASSQTNRGKRTSRGSQKRISEETVNTSHRRGCQNKGHEGPKNSEVETHRDSSEPGVIEQRDAASTYKILGQAVTQRLYESFKENEYPARQTKENLAKELGITFQQVTKWFGNARWSSRLSSDGASSRNKKVSPVDDQTTGKLVEPETRLLPKDADGSKFEDTEPSEANTPKIIRNVRDHNVDVDHQALNEASSGTRTLVMSLPANSPKTHKDRRKGRKMNQVTTPSPIQTRSRKTVSPEDE
ncbi:hypothetical protein IFM89_029235 [Coptis chinensis]|uniref:Homeobox domain-containing protein n=1 Tax=Coptis chinensis TaxID=261450 RepID=A0A835M7E3_9MAGN|nr:hypothetical protein IFM89_029235 [Coptis chinensis]